MNPIAFRWYWLAVLSFLSMTSQGQNSWSMQQCVQYALEHNLQVKQSALNVDQSKADQQQQYASFIPSLNGQIGHNYYWGRFIDPYTNNYTNQQVQSSSIGFNATMSVFQGFQLQYLLSQSKLNFMASRKDLEKIRNDISLNVVAAYLQVLYNQDMTAVLQGQVSATADQANRMKRMYELGSASKANYLDLQAQLANDSASLISGQTQLDQSVLTLVQLLELDSLQDFSVARPEVATVPGLSEGLSAEAVFTVALQTQPEIQGSRFRLQAAEKGLAAARASSYPRLYLSGNWNTNYSTSNKQVTGVSYGAPDIFVSGFTSSGDSVYTVSPNVSTTLSDVPFWDQLNNNRGSGLGLTLQLPIFNNWNVKTNVSRARIAMQQSKLNDELTRNNLFKSVQQAVLDAVNTHRKYESNVRSVSSLREAADFNKQRFELGLINTYEYAIAANNLARAEVNLLQAKYEYLFRVKVLDFYQGKPLTF